MAATAAMAAMLRRMVDEPTEDTDDDDTINDYIEKYPLIDFIGNEPLEVDYSTSPPTVSERDEWIPTYDLHAAAADIWEEKAAAIADEFTFSADGGSYSRSKKYDQYKASARSHRSQRAAKSSHVWVNPRKIKTEESNSD